MLKKVDTLGVNAQLTKKLIFKELIRIREKELNAYLIMVNKYE